MTAVPNISVDIGGLTLKNPVMTASGTFSYGAEFKDLMDLNRLGGIIVKGLSLKPQKGNPPPRIVETACGMLNAIGLENVGIEAFIAEKLPFLKTIDAPVIANIYGQSIEEYAALAARIDAVADIAGIELNISCPNVKSGGVAFGVDPDVAENVVARVREQTTKPLMVKLSPNVTDVVDIAKRVASGGADSISLINTITGMAVDLQARKPILANITGGLSGPAIKPIALRMVWQVAQVVDIPVIGIGGIMTAADALEFILVGAAAIQVGTANFVNPAVAVEIIDGIQAYLVEHDIYDIAALQGSLQIAG
jgi:dihydroorotate dehydrogenase (NAD+) catalytic subunit